MFEIFELITTCFIGQLAYRILKVILLSRSSNPTGKKHLILFLKNRKNFTRQQIIEFGRKAILDPISKELLVHPVVGPNGVSYEKTQIVDYIKNRENRENKENKENLSLSYPNFDNFTLLYDNIALKSILEIYINKLKARQ
jgi:hypothetical protein